MDCCKFESLVIKAVNRDVIVNSSFHWPPGEGDPMGRELGGLINVRLPTKW